MASFIELGVRPETIEALAPIGITAPFAIQEMVLPLALSGNDLIGQAKTGTGKTLGFGIPIIDRVLSKSEGATGKAQALVVVPTRELCVQVAEDLLVAGRIRDIRVLALYGGRAFEPQLDALNKGIDVVVGTPGRLLDLARQGHLKLNEVRILVLDEADEMLDLGFLPDIEAILRLIPEARQTMLFSATMPGEIITLARKFMDQPTHIRVAEEGGSTVEGVEQFAYRAHAMDKIEMLARILQAEGRGATVVFCRTKRTAAKVSDELTERGFASGAVHGDLGQGAREQALRAFRNGKVDILVATDVAARGIDVEGHSVIQWAANLDPNYVASLASKRTYPLNSSFRPTFNMAVNLIEAFGQRRSREVLETSFAQFQADRSVVGLARGIREKQASLDGYEESMRCHLGDFREYASLRRQISDIEREIAQTGRQARRNDLRASKAVRAQELQVANMKKALRAHACHSCPDRESHARWGERWYKLDRETRAIIKQIESRTNQVAKTFDRISQALIELEYLRVSEGDLEITEAGGKLAKIYGERDLLVAECIRRQTWHGVDSQTLAALAAALVYEARRDDENLNPKLPKGDFVAVFDETLAVWDDLQDLSKRNHLPLTSEPDATMALQMYRWATGSRLDGIMTATGMLAGDFIRWCKQAIDLLEQISKVHQDELSVTAQAAIDRIKRGIVAYSYYA